MTVCYNGMVPFNGNLWKTRPEAEGVLHMKAKRIIALAMLLILVVATPAMAASRAKEVLSVAVGQLGKPYALISQAPDSFNCASFVAYCFNSVDSGTISQGRIKGHAKKIGSIRKVKPGDILCFKSSGGEVGMLSYHFGIYMGKGRFIHASNSAQKVTISKLKSYSKRFIGALRVS